MKEFKWINAAERLPEESGYYIVWLGFEYNGFMVLPYSARHRQFNVHDDMTPSQVKKLSVPAVYWSDIPDLPEEATE